MKWLHLSSPVAHVYESLIHVRGWGRSNTETESIILRLKWTWNYCHAIWPRLLEKRSSVGNGWIHSWGSFILLYSWTLAVPVGFHRFHSSSATSFCPCCPPCVIFFFSTHRVPKRHRGMRDLKESLVNESFKVSLRFGLLPQRLHCMIALFGDKKPFHYVSQLSFWEVGEM